MDFNAVYASVGLGLTALLSALLCINPGVPT